MKNSEKNTEVVKAFFNAYNNQKPLEAIKYTAPNAKYNYVPLDNIAVGGFEQWAQVAEGLIGSFPNLHNEIKSIKSDEDGTIYAEVWIGGKHEKDFGPLVAKGNDYWLEHFFIFNFNEQNEIENMKCYWDNYTWFKQLNNLENFVHVTW
jgi:hypothetical protein